MGDVLRYDNLRYYTPTVRSSKPSVIETDVCIYGGTPAGIAAAIQARRMGKRALILEFSQYLGGMTASGLSHVEITDPRMIGGITREFFVRVGRHYGEPIKFNYEPRIAERLLGQMVRDAKVAVSFQQHLASVKKQGRTIREVHLENGNIVRAAMFIDCSYEGDLMAAADVRYTAGREANGVYQETLNGVRLGSGVDDFSVWIDPYVKKSEPRSGLLPCLSQIDVGQQEMGDSAMQSYFFRLILTNDPGNRTEIPKPALYNRHRYHLMARYLKHVPCEMLEGLSHFPGKKAELIPVGPVSTCHVNGNANWLGSDFRKREKIFQDHVNYTMGLIYFLSHDKAVPQEIRDAFIEWGLPQDEFLETGGWPHHLNVTSSRRLLGERVMTEPFVRGQRKASDPISIGTQNILLYPARRLVLHGRVVNDGGAWAGISEPYRISYRAICPRRNECSNLLVPVCLSSSYVAEASLRCDATLMSLGQAAGTAAVIAIDDGVGVQDVEYDVLREELLHDQMVIRWPPAVKPPGTTSSSTANRLRLDDQDTKWDTDIAGDLPQGWVFEE